MKRTYDFIVGIGGACCCSQALRAARLQFASFPFDWVAKSDIRVRADQVRDDFTDWIRKSDLERFQEEETNTGVVMRNVRTGVVFPHDFHRDVPFEVEWEAVAAKYRRRADHLARLVAAAKRVLVVWVDVKLSPSATDEDIRYVLEIFRRRWPGVKFEFLHFKYEAGRKFADRIDAIRGDVRTVTFDYRDAAEGQFWIADHRLLGRWLAREYAMPDYRTPEERAKGRALAKAKRYARYRATGWIDYCATKFAYKLYVHLQKRLKRKGIV